MRVFLCLQLKEEKKGEKGRLTSTVQWRIIVKGISKTRKRYLPWFDFIPPQLNSTIWVNEEYEYGESTGIRLKVHEINYEYKKGTCCVFVEPVLEEIDKNPSYFSRELSSLLNRHWFEYSEIVPWLEGKGAEMPTKYKKE